MTTKCEPPTPLRERFARTVCDCADCSRHCHYMPGMLGTGDLQRIADHLGVVPAEILHLFRASPGALAMRGDQTFRIGTIVPAKDKNTGYCVFLMDNGHCRIHDVAPYGCSHFDDHMDAAEGKLRSSLMLQELLTDRHYALEREMVARVGGTARDPVSLRKEYMQ